MAAILTDILADKDARAPAFGPFSALSFPFQCAIKTGTSKNYRDLWTLGYTTDYTVGVWIGNFNGDPTKGLAGSTGSAPLFRSIMFLLHKNQWPANFQMPTTVVKASVCPKSGLKPNSWCPATILEYFLVGTLPQELCQVHQVVDLDSRNGLLARGDIDSIHVRRQLYEVYPAIYRIWCAQNQVEQPPMEVSPFGFQAKIPETLTTSPTHADGELHITYPDYGDVFVIDPVLRQEHQAITLSPSVPFGVSSIRWIVDNKLYRECPSPFAVTWQLEPGEHRFKIKAQIQGVWRESPTVKIIVL